MQISTEAALREARLAVSQLRVRPVSMISSTIRTWRPVMSVSRSLRMRTTPELLVPEPYDETAIQSISTCPLEGPGDVGHHHHRTAEHADDQQLLALVVALDLLGQLADALLDLRLGEQDVDQVALDVGCVHVEQRVTREGVATSGRCPDMRLSVLDLVPVRSDQTTGDALAATRRLAQVADGLGFERYWLAEHHNMPAVAATNPPVLIAMVAAATSRIRVGSGGVMLPNHAPLVVAEQFALLEAAYPGRIDLGIGRAPGTDPVTSWALRHGAGGVSDEAVTQFPTYVDNVISMMSPGGVGLEVGGRMHPLNATPHAIAPPPVWLLGSSDYSAQLAADRGLPYVFAHHFSGPRHGRGARPLPLGVPALRAPRRAAHLPHGQRRGGARRRRRPTGWCCPT